MERKQVIPQRVRDYFGEHLDQVLQSIRQDREELRGWQEPAHLRAVLRRAVREDGAEGRPSSAGILENEIGRGAGEPDRGEQREALGQILEAGAVGLQKLIASPMPSLTSDELIGLECVILLYGRPGLLVNDGKMAQGPAFWNLLEDQRDDIELTQSAVGRIEMIGHPDYDWAGTGFLVGESCLMTTYGIARLFVEECAEQGCFQFRPGISAWMDYQGEYQRPVSAAHRVKGVLGIHEQYDLALLEVETPHQNGAPTALALANEPPPRLEGRPVYLISYPIQDARRSEPGRIARIFRDDYNVKRIQPGTLRALSPFRGLHLLQHDCAPLGHSAGGCLIDLETHRVLGMHVSGRYLENGTAVPLWMLQDDPLLKRCQVAYAKASGKDVEKVNHQIERLARSRLWDDARSMIAGLYERAYGKESTSSG